MRKNENGEYTRMGLMTEGVKGFARRFEDTPFAWHSSRSEARKRASAEIAKIPLDLAQWIARVYKPEAQ
jgi:hypothetical protein